MRAARMEAAIASLGARTSGFEQGENVRGNLGRGAKDLAAFGTVVFESVCDDKYSKLVLEPSGDYELLPDQKADAGVRTRLHIPRGTGTVVTMQVGDQFRCPRHDKLFERLASHFQLRDILSDPRREILLEDAGSQETRTIRYSYPSLPILFTAELVVPGYPEATAMVTIYRNAERYDDPPSDPGRPAGLLIKGRRAIYENTLFRFETNPYAGWFSGRVECAYIDEVARDYDNRMTAGEPATEENPIPIITRRRDGLQHTHPFYRALAAAVEEELGRLVAAEEATARRESAENSRIRRTLDALGRDLGRLLDDDMREIDEEGLEGGGGVGTDDEVPALRLVPSEIVMYMGEDKSVSVQVRRDLGITQVHVEVDPEGVVELLDGADLELLPHKARRDLLTGQIRLRALLEDEETAITVSAGVHHEVGLIEVRPERILEEVEIQPPATLQFERDGYRVTYGKRKKLVVIAPAELVDVEGKDVRVSSSTDGIAVLGEATLEYDDDLDYYTATVVVEGRQLGAKAIIRAVLGEVTATCQVVVLRTEEGPRLQVRIENDEAGFRRAIVDPGEVTTIRIMGLHPVIRRYRGAAPEHSGEDKAAFKALLAEIIAGEVVRMLMEHKYRAGATEFRDAASLYVDHGRYLSKYLARCHRMLVPDGALE